MFHPKLGTSKALQHFVAEFGVVVAFEDFSDNGLHCFESYMRCQPKIIFTANSDRAPQKGCS